MKQRRLVPQHDLWNDLVLAEEYLGHPLPQLARTFRRDLFSDELYMAVPSLWKGHDPQHVARRPFAMEPAGPAS